MQRPEEVGGVPAADGRRIPPAASGVRQFDGHALEHLVVGLGAGLIEDANAPGHGFLALELIRQHAEWTGLPSKA